MYTLAKRSHTHVKDPVVRPCESSVDYGNIKITQHALKLASLQNVQAGHYTEEEEEEEERFERDFRCCCCCCCFVCCFVFLFLFLFCF